MDIYRLKYISREAGRKILEFRSRSFGIYSKRDFSPVTEADLASEKVIKEELKKTGYPILSEEAGEDKKRLKSKRVWIVDPLDGTSDFIQGREEFCVIISLVEGGMPIAGVIYVPVSNLFYFAKKGGGAFVERDNGKVERLRVSSEQNYANMKIIFSRNHLLEVEARLSQKLNLKKEVMGSAGLKLCRVAAGEAEIYLNSSNKTHEWDTCAGNLILEEAGGNMTDLAGNKILYNQANSRHLCGYIATNGMRHKDILLEIK